MFHAFRTSFVIARSFRSVPAASLLLIAALEACGTQPIPHAAAVPVTTAAVARRDVPIMVEATGTVEPRRSVAIHAEVGGILTRLGFEEGQPVREGQVLFEIDPRPLQAALMRADAELARDLAQVETVLPNAARTEELAARDVVSQQQVEQARANKATLRATLRADSAAVEEARLNLRYATVRAPISGRAGAIRLREGSLVQAGAGEPLVVVNQLSPIWVRFPVAAPLFDAVRRRAAAARLPVTATPLSDSLGSAPQEGILVFFDNAVDPATNTVTLKGEFDNRDGALWPGALVRVALQLDVARGALVVPRAAVEQNQAGTVVWVVDSARTAHLRPITMGQGSDSLAVILRGLAEGEQVVTDGQLRLVDGARVDIRDVGPPV